MRLTRYGSPNFGSDFSQLLSRFFDDQRPLQADFLPAVDVSETKDAYILKAELPGLKRDQIQVEIKDNTLIMRGERKFEQNEASENYHRIERGYGSFVRSFELPKHVDTQAVEANFTDGVLTLTIAKRAESKSQTIKIQ